MSTDYYWCREAVAIICFVLVLTVCDDEVSDLMSSIAHILSVLMIATYVAGEHKM